jgi:hypothetical protein
MMPHGNGANTAFQVVGTYLATLRSLEADVPPALVAQIDPIVKAQCDAVLRVFTHQNDPAFNTRSIFSFGSGGAGPISDYRIMVPRAEADLANAAMQPGIGTDPHRVSCMGRPRRLPVLAIRQAQSFQYRRTHKTAIAGSR